MLVCIDTPLLIYLQRESPPDGQEDLYKAAKQYEQWFRTTDWNLLIPTPVIAEFLCSKDAAKRQKILQTYQQFADIHPFDLRASELAARIRLEYHLDQGLPGKNDPRRQTLTVDMMIAAVAIVNGASYIITHDVDDFEAITADFENIDVRGVLESPPGQPDLPNI